MLALSIKQPWAWAILNAGKDIENRRWATNVRGTIAIHASKKMEDWEFTDFLRFVAYPKKTLRFPESLSSLPTPKDLIFGSILGTVEIVDCVTKSDSAWFQGDYGFVLANPKPLIEPIPCRGALGFWKVPTELTTPILIQTQGF